jgi:hypothetical protein
MIGSPAVIWALFFSILAFSAVSVEAQFSKTLYPVLEKAACRACHNPDGVASATRLHFPEPDAAPERIEAFGRSLVALVDRKQPGESLLLKKPTNRTTHTGGERIKPGSGEEVVLEAWIDRLARLGGDELAQALRYGSEPPAPAAQERSRVVLRRLTHSQYNNTVRDLLGELSQPANQFPPEDYVNGFRNQYQSQNLSPMLFEAYSAAAERLARNAFRMGDARRLIPCRPSPACRSEFVRSFGLKAFRRPLDREELKRYEALFASDGSFLEGAQGVVEAMLQSPNFLFQLEETPDPKLQPYAAASRLSYALWDTMPDAALLESAARGELNTPAGVERVTRRMLADEKARQALDEFVSQWMRFDRARTASRDRRKYPKFTRETGAAMVEETRQFVAGLVWGDRNFMELFTADHGYLNAELASIYGLPAPAKEFERVQFPAESERAGLLGQALFLTLTSNPDETSLTARGLFVREQFLCQHVADPPPGVNTDLPPVTEAKPQTNRQRLGVHTTNQSCAGCHNLMDPIGYGLEKFDAIGGRREKMQLAFYPERRQRDAKPRILELDLDTAGWVAGIPDSNFSSPRELGAILARTPQCQECVVKQYFRFTAGRPERPADRPLIRKVFEDFRNSGFRFQQLITSLMVAREFPNRTGAYDVSSNRSPR